ncbi:MAG: hypothetical protein OXL96_13970 [Candidatus Poribacteria bacterium]|nr:hypothetical protein [Candidatus Poribacteria bacterium]
MVKLYVHRRGEWRLLSTYDDTKRTAAMSDADMGHRRTGEVYKVVQRGYTDYYAGMPF